MKERDLLNWTIALARTTGWQVWHIPAPMRATREGGFAGAREAAGLPDLILIHDNPPRLIFAELKGDGGQLTDRQQDFLQGAVKVADAIRPDHDIGAGRSYPYALIGVYAWTPADCPEIERTLTTRGLYSNRPTA